MQEQATEVMRAVMDSPVDIPWWLIVAIVVVAAAVSWAVTEAVKKTALAKLKFESGGNEEIAVLKRRLWWSPLLVFVAIAIGAVIGGVIAAVEWRLVYGAALGAGGGATSSFVVWAAKKYVKGRLGAVADGGES